jgi:hypothetical protein
MELLQQHYLQERFTNKVLSRVRKLKCSRSKRGIDIATKAVVKYLKENYSKDITEEEQIKQVATISGNNDTEVGNLNCNSNGQSR